MMREVIDYCADWTRLQCSVVEARDGVSNGRNETHWGKMREERKEEDDQRQIRSSLDQEIKVKTRIGFVRMRTEVKD